MKVRADINYSELKFNLQISFRRFVLFDSPDYPKKNSMRSFLAYKEAKKSRSNAHVCDKPIMRLLDRKHPNRRLVSMNKLSPH